MKVVLLPKKTRGGTVVAQMVVPLRRREVAVRQSGRRAARPGSLLMRGTKSHTRQQIQDEMDRLKAHISVGGNVNSRDSASIETTEANLAGALKLAAEILREPAFPESEFETVKGQRIAGIEAGKSDPQNLAFLELEPSSRLRVQARRHPRTSRRPTSRSRT